VKVNNIGLINGPITVMHNTKDSKNADATYSMIANHDHTKNSSVMEYLSPLENELFFLPLCWSWNWCNKNKNIKTSIRPVHQSITGLNYQIIKDTDIYIGCRHFGLIGGNFDEFTTSKKIEVPAKAGKPKTLVLNKMIVLLLI
ncbi:Hypothetical protein CINCED_3A008191, partial [Cinara cedri]